MQNFTASYIVFAKFTGKHLCQSLFFNKVRPATLLKKRLWHRCFLVNFAKFLRTHFLTEHLRWLLLQCCLLKAALFWKTMLGIIPFQNITSSSNSKYLRKLRANEGSSHWRCSVKKSFLRNFAKFTRTHLCMSLPFNKAADLGLQPY